MGDEGEEAFDLVEPGGIGGREVNVPTRTAGEPGLDLGMLVGGVVVDDEMDVELGRHIGLDVAQEGEELLVTMAGFALGDDRTVFGQDSVRSSEVSFNVVISVCRPFMWIGLRARGAKKPAPAEAEAGDR